MRRGGKLSVISMTATPVDRRPRTGDPWVVANGARAWFKIYNVGVGTVRNDSTRIDIYEEIGGWGVSAAEFVDSLRAVTSPAIDLHINSPGGSVFDGVAIYNALSQHPARVDGFVDGLAASAASFIAQACDSITMNPGSMMMVHDAIGMTWGNALDHTTMAGLLTQVSDSIADLYAARAGGTAADWRAVMENNGGEGKWYTARESVDAGLADRVAGDPEPGDSTGEPGDVSPTDRYDASSLAAGHRLVQGFVDALRSSQIRLKVDRRGRVVAADAPPARTPTLPEVVDREFGAAIAAWERDAWSQDAPKSQPTTVDGDAPLINW